MANSTTTQRKLWAAHRCEVGETITLFGKKAYLQKEAHEAGRALEAALYDYGPVSVLGSHRWCPTGIEGKTCQATGTNCSLHNYSIALDFDPFQYGNPHLYRPMTEADWKKTKFTKAQVARVEAIRTNNGKQVWRWLGALIGDTMHFEITCGPADLATGINWATVPGGKPAQVGTEQVIDKNSPKKSPAVAMFQRDLIRLGYDLGDWPPIQAGLYPPGADGNFGAGTEAAIKAFQQAMGLKVTGVGDALTVATAANLARFSDHRAGVAVADNTARTAANAAKTAADAAKKAADAAAKTASAAKTRADNAHVRLDKLKSI